MKRRVFSFAVALLTVAMASNADNIEIKGVKLTELTELVKIKGENVNLRKAPSVNAPRLVSLVYDGEFADPVGVWSDEVKGKTAPVYDDGYRVYVQTDRNYDYGTSDDIPENADFWVKMAYNTCGIFVPVWVKRDFCDLMPAGSITPDNYYGKSNYQKYQLSIRKSGRYKGLCLYQAIVEDTPEDPEGLYVGMLVDGQVLLPLRFRQSYLDWCSQDESVDGIEIGDGYVRYNPAYEGDASDDDMGGFMTVDMDRFTDSDIARILSQCEYDTEYGQFILLKNTSEGGFFRVCVPTDGSSFCGLSVQRVCIAFPVSPN